MSTGIDQNVRTDRNALTKELTRAGTTGQEVYRMVDDVTMNNGSQPKWGCHAGARKYDLPGGVPVPRGDVFLWRRPRHHSTARHTRFRSASLMPNCHEGLTDTRRSVRRARTREWYRVVVVNKEGCK